MPGLPAVASACFTARVPVSADARLVAVAPATPHSEHMSEAAMAEPGEDISAEAVWAELGIADDE
jgi:hypothetical protein